MCDTRYSTTAARAGRAESSRRAWLQRERERIETEVEIETSRDGDARGMIARKLLQSARNRNEERGSRSSSKKIKKGE